MPTSSIKTGIIEAPKKTWSKFFQRLRVLIQAFYFTNSNFGRQPQLRGCVGQPIGKLLGLKIGHILYFEYSASICPCYMVKRGKHSEDCKRRLSNPPLISVYLLGECYLLPGIQKGANDRVFCDILAEEPEAFARCGSFEKMLVYGRQEFSVSNMGVKTQVQALSESLAGKKHATRYILPLACSLASQQSLVVMLKKVWLGSVHQRLILKGRASLARRKSDF